MDFYYTNSPVNRGRRFVLVPWSEAVASQVNGGGWVLVPWSEASGIPREHWFKCSCFHLNFLIFSVQIIVGISPSAHNSPFLVVNLKVLKLCKLAGNLGEFLVVIWWQLLKGLGHWRLLVLQSKSGFLSCIRGVVLIILAFITTWHKRFSSW